MSVLLSFGCHSCCVIRRQIGKNEGDQTIDKINFTLESLMDTYEELRHKLDDIAREFSRLSRTTMLAGIHV